MKNNIIQFPIKKKESFPQVKITKIDTLWASDAIVDTEYSVNISEALYNTPKDDTIFMVE